jgi:hypothetical protein
LTAKAIKESRELEAMMIDNGASMQWTGNLFADEEPVVLYGTAKVCGLIEFI